MGISYFSLFIFLFLSVSTLRPVCGNAELRALIELKGSLDPQNKLLTSWSSDGDPCSGSFEGVACNEHRKVANISLQGKGLSGKLSPAVAELKCLSGLYLHYKSLSGEIPKEISQLSELSDLYLNVNNLSGNVPPEIGDMASLQVLELCCNQLTGNIPMQIGSLKKLSVFAVQHNSLTGKIPERLGNLGMLRRLDLGFNGLSGIIPATLATIPQLEVVDVRNNSLSGIVPSGLKKLNDGFLSENNPGLCGIDFPSLRACTAYDDLNINQLEPFRSKINKTDPKDISKPTDFEEHCNHTHCPKSSKLPRIIVVAGVITVTATLVIAGLVAFFRYRLQKQKIGNTSECSDGQLSTDHAKELSRSGTSPLVSLEYANGWDSGFFQEHHNKFRFSLEEIESATQCFSEINLLGRSNFSSVYKGILRDGSVVAIRSINITSCKNEESEFVKGLNLLTSLKHENLVRLRGFCCSRGRGECFLLYDFAANGTLSKYLDVEYGSTKVLDWSKRLSIINGVAKGMEYLHRSEANKPTIVHRNISTEKILIDHQFRPLIADSGIHKLLADDIVFSALKTSAAMGYLAPEYITTGRFTEKTDIFAFGVIILQIIYGKIILSNSMRLAAESCRYEGFIDENLRGEFSELEAAKLAKIALACTHELPGNRPTFESVIQEMSANS